jgi:hypothetical protein
MLSVEEIITLIGLLSEISPKDQKSRNQINQVKEYLAEHAEDPDYQVVEDSESSEEESDVEPEEHIIDRTDPNYISIK